MTTGWALAAALLLLPSAARGQQAATEDREALRRFIARADVQRVAHLADLDLEDVSAGIMTLEGDLLSRAADQARAIEGEMGADDTISIQKTTLIILLLILLIVVIAL
jgi:triphosphoribosyl-dephospho-CoA synthetase